MRTVYRIATLVAVLAWSVPAATGAQRTNGSGALALMVAEFERSYVSTADLRGTGPDLHFEANIAPPFFLASPDWRTALVATPKVVLRMFDSHSAPVRTPSYMPRLTFYYFPREALAKAVSEHSEASFVELTLSHHSNGQDGPQLNPDGSVNHLDGSFSTNFLEITYASSFLSDAPFVRMLPRGVRRAFAHVRYSYEWHLPRSPDMANRLEYSISRVHVASGGVFPVNTDPGAACVVAWRVRWNECLRDVYVAYRVTYLSGRVAERFRGRGRFPVSANVGLTPTFSRDVSFYVEYVSGQDYYNTYFDRSLNALRIGMRANRGAEPERTAP